MFFNVLVFLSPFIIFATTSRAETLTTTTDAVEISSRATSGFDANVTQEQEWRSNESIQQNRQPIQKVVNIDSSSLHKHRRDGIENLPEHDYRRRYFLDFPEHYEYENELYHRGEKNRQQQYQQQYQQPYQNQYQQHRNRDETYPVRVQGCPMRDVRPYAGANMPFQNQGALQGWLTGSGWRGSHDDKRYESSYPLQVTTATPKVAPYRNRDYTRYNFGHHDKSGAPYKPRYDPEAGVSATRDYNSQIRDIERNPPTWMQPYQQPSQQQSYQQQSYQQQPSQQQSYQQQSYQQQPYQQQSYQQPSRNNRIVYYEYNLDNRRPSSGKCHPMDRNCGSNAPWYAGSGHGSRFDGGHRFQTSDTYYRNQQPYYSRPEGGRSEDSGQEYEYEDEDRYRSDGRAGGRQNAGIGYVYSIDLPMERAISPSTAYDYDMGFARKTQGYRHAPMPHLDT